MSPDRHVQYVIWGMYQDPDHLTGLRPKAYWVFREGSIAYKVRDELEAEYLQMFFWVGEF